jgi:hypothetical protein
VKVMSKTEVLRAAMAAVAAIAVAGCGGGGGGDDAATPTTGAPAPAPVSPPPPPWGALTLGGSNDLARTFKQFAPNFVPVAGGFSATGGAPQFSGAIWRMESAWDARATLEPPTPALGGDVVIASDNPSTPGPLVGLLFVALRSMCSPTLFPRPA